MRRVESIQALGPLQQGMLYHAAAAEGPGEHFIQFVFTIERVNPQALRRAWKEIVAAHGALRTGFSWETAGASVAVVMTGVELPWREEDWRGLSEDAFADRLALYLQEDRARSFTLTRAPLMRALLLREADQRWRLCLSYHHLLMDGWSAALLFDELAERYRALLAGEAPDVPERRPYADFLAWHATQDVAAAETWWRAHLAEAPATPLPFASPAAGPRRMAQLAARLGAEEWNRLRSLGRDLGATLATLTAGAWALLLARAQGEEDAVFGATLSGRPESLAGSDAMIGLFINTVPVRIRPVEALPLAVFLTRLQRVMVEVREHAYLPLPQIQAWAGPARAAFDTLFVYENYPAARAATASALGVVDAVCKEETSYPGTLILEPDEDAFAMTLIYDAARLGERDAERLIARYKRLLTAMAAAGPDARLCDLSYLGEEDEFAAAGLAAAPAEPCLTSFPDLFLKRANDRPAAPALICGGETISYGALRERALSIAAALKEGLVPAGSVVGVALPRDSNLVPALLGTMLAGCAYLPLDSDQPPGRADAVCSTVGAAAFICVESTRHLCRAALQIRADRLLPPPVPEPAPIAADGLAYVIPTSGSTGAPKAVAIDHRSLAALIDWSAGAYPPSAFARAAATTSIGFDVSVFELFAPLAAGGTILLLDGVSDLDDDVEASLVSGVPSLLAGFGLPRSATHLNLAGEPLPQSFADRLAADGCRVVRNLYGPTEATVYATMADMRCGEVVTIGRPLPHVSAYVLNPALRPVAVGDYGELYLAGPALARAYLGAPGATARAFVPNPFGAPGARMYRTGDRVRLLADGRLAFAGRKDGQAKINGIRVEIGEIEAAVHAAGFAADEAAVAIVSDSGGRQRLVTCLTRDRDPAGLDAALADRLPVPLRPQLICRLEELPRTSSGKLDRKRLAVLAAGAAARAAPSGGGFRNSAEAAVARAIASALGVENVGPEDDFFALGGDSIVSLQAAAAARKAGFPLSPRDFVALRTPRAIAAALVDAQPVEMVEPGLDGDCPLGAIQSRFFAEERSNPHHFNQALLLTLEPDVDLDALQAALAAAEAAHPSLRFRYRHDAEGIRQRTVAPTGVPLERLDLANGPESVLGEAITAACARLQAGLDIHDGPTFRAAYLDAGPEAGGRLLLLAHHLCIDGVSWRILMDDIAAAYAQARAGLPARLPAEATSFGQWAVAAREHASSPARAADWERWLEISRAPAARIPCDGRGEHHTGSDALVVRSLDGAVTNRLLRGAPARYGAGINAVLLGALGRTLCGWAGGPLIVDLEGHGREELDAKLDLSRTVGWFTSLFPLRLDISAEAPLEEAVAAAARALDLPDAGISYGILRYLSGDPRATALAEAAGQVLFNYLGQLDGIVSAPPVAGWAAEDAGADEASGESRSHLIDINVHVTGGELVMVWRYSPGRHREDTVICLAEAYAAALRMMADEKRELPPAAPALSEASKAELLARIAARMPQGA